MAAADSAALEPTPPSIDLPARKLRPRDRKQRILAAAARQFWTRGYHQVSMVDIAAELGIAASALYRHYPGKQALLIQVLSATSDHLAPDTLGAEDLDALIARIASLSLRSREFGALWDRENGHLPDAARTAVADRLRAVIGATATAIGRHGPTETADVLDLRARAVVAVLESPSYHRAEVDPARFEALLRAIAHAMARCELPTGDGRPDGGRSRGRDPQAPLSRREALLSAAVRLFAERGYPAVSLGDIGSATGIAGPSIYNYYATKHDLLSAGLNRGNEALWLSLHHAFVAADGPLDALHRTLDSYIEFVAANPDIVSVMLAETVRLPDEQRPQFRRPQQEYVAELVALMRRHRPELNDPEARILINAALALPNTLARQHHLRRRSELVPELSALARAVLQTTTAVPGPAR